MYITAQCPPHSWTTLRIWHSCVKAPSFPSPHPVKISRVFSRQKERSLYILPNLNALLMVRKVSSFIITLTLFVCLSLLLSFYLSLYPIIIVCSICCGFFELQCSPTVLKHRNSNLHSPSLPTVPQTSTRGGWPRSWGQTSWWRRGRGRTASCPPTAPWRTTP